MQANLTVMGPGKGTIRFIMGGKIINLHSDDPSMTTLSYLRQVVAKTGTKEACGQGDCGACTVVLANLECDGMLRYRAVNSCLHRLPFLDGKELITIEDLKTIGRPMHPIQQAMVDCHGSQCGYCTPGVVMALLALYKSHQKPDRRTVENALVGNLCRCTGYRSIIKAAFRMYDLGREIPENKQTRLTQYFHPCETGRYVNRDALDLHEAIKRSEPLRISGIDTDGGTIHFLAPVNLPQLETMLQETRDPLLVAGGTDSGAQMLQQASQAQVVILIAGVKELAQVSVLEDCIEIGAAARLTDVYPVLAKFFPAFAQLLQRFGSPSIRNQATMGGNIASRSSVGDTLPALIVLNSTMLVRSFNNCRTVSVEDFHSGKSEHGLQPGEFIQSIRIPRLSRQTIFSTYKVSKRHDCDIATVNAAFHLELKETTVSSFRGCYGGMSAQARRAFHCEQSLIGQPWAIDNVEIAAQCIAKDYLPIADVRGSSQYRSLVAKNLLKRFYFESSSPIIPIRIADYQNAYE